MDIPFKLFLTFLIVGGLSIFTIAASSNDKVVSKTFMRILGSTLIGSFLGILSLVFYWIWTA